MALSDDCQLQFNSLLVGADTDYEVITVRGLDDLPEMRTSDVGRPSDHGLFPGRDLAAGRTIEVELEVWGDTDLGFRANIDALGAATVPRDDELALVFRLPGFTDDRQIMCRPRRRALPVDLAYEFRLAGAAVQFFATDPRVYSATETVLSTAAATSGGGRTYNRVYPLTYAAGGTGGNLLAANTGNFPSRPLLTITGPSTSPRIENVTTGQYLGFDLVVATGEFLEIDIDARTVLLNGTASRYSSITPGSSWWEIAAGATTLKFTAADSQGTLEVRYRNAWI